MKDLKSDLLWGNIDALIIDVAVLQKIKVWKHVLKIKSSIAKTADVIYLKSCKNVQLGSFFSLSQLKTEWYISASHILRPEASQRLDNNGKRETSIPYPRMFKNVAYLHRNINK